ncbi:MAG: TonB family protein [Saprospiraceae bacterium]|jgi:TonB family protein
MKYLIALCCLFCSVAIFAQSEVAKEEIFQVVEEMPMFPGCTDSTGTKEELKSCADSKMLQFIYQNIKYPEVDRQKGNEGTVVITFVVEKDGSISNEKILRDPGDQLGEEALRVVSLMNQLPEKWTPGKKEGVPVKVQFNLPVKFRLEDVVEPDFVMSGRDSVWVNYNTSPAYKDGDEALVTYIDQSLKYPDEGQDSCRIGIVELKILINGDGSLNITDVVDYSDLGIDYQFEAIRIINATSGDWTPATLGDRNVNTNKTIRLTFRPNFVACGDAISNFELVDRMVDEATVLIEGGNAEEGIAKLTEAIDQFPNNGEYLSIRGQAYLKIQKTEEACADLKRAKEILVVSWFDNLIPLLCK